MKAALDSMNLENLRVLIVEDEFIIALGMKMELESLGAKVIGPAGTVADALQALQDDKIDAAVLDWNLHGQPSDPVADELINLKIPFFWHTGTAAGAELVSRYVDVPLIRKPSEPEKIVEMLCTITAA